MNTIEASGSRSGFTALLMLLLRAASITTAGLGFVALLGWVLGWPRLASFGAGLMPMAPSTAVLFLLYGLAIGVRVQTPFGRRALRISVAAVCVGALVALLLFVLSCLEIHWEVEHLGLNATETLGGVPTGHMSPVTAFCFLLASVSFLASLPGSPTRPWRAALALGSAGVLLGTSYIFLLAYFFGAPLLYGGTFIPPAINTIIAFATLSLALMALARGPAVLFRGSPADGSRAGSLFASIFLLLTVGIVAIGYIYYRNYENAYRVQVERQLTTITETKVSELVQYREDRGSDVAIFFKNHSFAALARRFFAQPADADAQAQLLDWLGNIPASDDYDQVRLLDTQGVTRLSLPGGLAPATTDTLLVAAEVLRSGQVTFQDFYRHERNHRVYLQVLVPILDESDGNRPLGVLVLRIDPTIYLYPFLKRWPTSNQSGETILVRREGNDAVFLNDLKFQTDATLNRRVSLENTGFSVVSAVLGKRGIVEGLDYCGCLTIAAVGAVPDSPWFLVARIDAEEVDAPLWEHFWQMVLLLSVLLFGSGAGLWLVWRQQRVRFYRDKAAAAEVLRESQSRLAGIVDSAMDGIITLDGEERILVFNAAAEKMFGCAAAEAIGQPVERFIPERFRSAHHQHLQRFAQIGDTPRVVGQSTRISGLHPNGEEFPFEASISSTEVNGHRLFTIILHDITERLRGEQARVRLEAELNQARKLEALGTLAGGIAHDFNNILGTIIGNTELARQDVGPGHPASMSLDEIRKTSHRAKGLVQSILAFGRRHQQPQNVIALRPVVEEALVMLRAALPAGVELATTFDADAPTVLADPAQIDQVLINLCTNAWHAMKGHAGRIDIRLEGITMDAQAAAAAVDLRPGHFARLSVTDTGIGMDAATLQRIFEPFFTTKPVGQGTGLGLSVVHGIVKTHGGAVTVRSQQGTGTTFSLYFPAVEAPAENARSTGRGSAAAGGRAENTVNGIASEGHGNNSLD